MAAFDRCEHCGRLRYIQNGLYDECATYTGATRGGSLFGFGFGSRPTCPECGGTGEVRHIFGSPTKCPTCHGTGKQ